MSGESERTVSAATVVVLSAEQLSHLMAVNEERARVARAERAERAKRRQDAIRRWQAIQDAGGEGPWIEAELRAKGLFTGSDVDASTLTAAPEARSVTAAPEARSVTAAPEARSLSDAEKSSFKERKKAEAAERRALEKLAWESHRATHVQFVGAGIFYRDEDDEPVRDKDARVARAKANDLGWLDSPTALATALGVDAPTLRWMCFHREVETASHYHFWTIPKRDGSRRAITAPKKELKRVQRWLLSNVVEKLPVHSAAHGFLRARSIATNAAAHAGADVVVKIDVKDFFPTVTFRRVKGLFRKGGLPESVATLCALLATEPPREAVQFRGKTLYVAKGPRACPQGAPTSPAITNAVCLRLDRRMSGLSRALGFTYTRYADDLAFSWRNPEGTKGSRTPAPIGTLLRGVATILENEGFRVHRKKTAVRRAGSTQRITGLVVNKVDRPGVPPARVPRETVRRLKAAIFNREKGKPGREGESLQQLKGMAAFVYMVDPRKGRAFLDRLAALEARGA